MGIFPLVEFGYAKLHNIGTSETYCLYAIYLSVIGIVNKMVVDAIKFVYISFIKTLIFKVVEKYLISQM